MKIPLIYPDEKEDYDEQMGILEKRSGSPQIIRKTKLRHLQREGKINFDEGIKKAVGNESQLSMTMGSVVSQEEAPTPTHPGGNDHHLEVGGMGIGDVSGMMMAGGEGGGMSASDIKKLFAQFKNDMKPMITDIAERLSENKVVTLKRVTDLYE